MSLTTDDTAPVDHDLLGVPLSEAEIDELAEFLDSKAATGNGMKLEKADGFLCAIAIGPDLLPSSEWLPLILGGEKGVVFQTQEQAERITQLIFRHWNAVLSAVRNNPKDSLDCYLPILDEPVADTTDGALDTDFGKAWADGFGIGASLDSRWDDCFQDEAICHCFAPIVLLSMGHNPDKPDMVIDYAKRQNLVLLLPAVAHEVFCYWREQRSLGLRSPLRQEPYRATQKIGRNDPCPCGSGKKFKKCCGQVGLH